MENNNLFTAYPDIVSVKDFMNMLKIGKTLAYQLILDKQVKSIKIGREYKIFKSSIIDFINNRS